jgi:glutaredoxin
MQTADNNAASIVMYSTTWCPDCHRAKRYFQMWGIEYSEVNIEMTPGAAEKVMGWANGKRVVPTITIGDRVLVNPRAHVLAEALGVNS